MQCNILPVVDGNFQQLLQKIKFLYFILNISTGIKSLYVMRLLYAMCIKEYTTIYDNDKI